MIAKEKGKKSKFKKHFTEFWNRFAEHCPKQVLYSGDLIDQVINWLTVIASSKLRAFRHTATVAGLNLVNSLIAVALNERNEGQRAQRQVRCANIESVCVT